MFPRLLGARIRCIVFIASLTLPFGGPARAQGGASLTMDQAVAIALQRNRDVMAARLDIEEAELEKVAASLYPNPILSYTAGNVVIPHGNAQDQGLNPGPFSQLQHTVSISEVIDVWAKRSARMRAAGKGVEHRRLLVEDALRDIVHEVRAAFVDLVREQLETDLTRSIKSRYDETVRISGARFRAGEISEADFHKIELEGLKYQNALIDAEMELDLARQHLARLEGLSSASALPGPAVMPDEKRVPPNPESLTAQALKDRPDFLAARQGLQMSDAALAAAEREAYPDISLGVAYTHSEFTASGDNPNALSLTVSLPLPIFDRNQANVGRAHLDAKRFDNELVRLDLQIRQEVAEAVRRLQRAGSLLDVYEGGGMLERADKALKVAENSYKAGSISVLELLDAQRTFSATRADYLRAQSDYRQAQIDVTRATGRRAQ